MVSLFEDNKDFIIECSEPLIDLLVQKLKPFLLVSFTLFFMLVFSFILIIYQNYTRL